MSQTTRIKKYLEKGGKLTQLKALKMFGCMRLASRIGNLKDLGMEITTTTIERNGKRFAEYRRG